MPVPDEDAFVYLLQTTKAMRSTIWFMYTMLCNSWTRWCHIDVCRCEVSGGAGQEWPTEVCEMWRFFSCSRILKLMGFMALHSDVLAVKQRDPCKQRDGIGRQHVLDMLQSMNE